MNTQKPALEHARIGRAIRLASFVFLLGLATISFLSLSKSFEGTQSHTWASIPIGTALTLLAVAQGVWAPYTKQKVSIFLNSAVVLGALLTVLVTGFSTLVYLSWAAMELIAIIYFGTKRAMACYAVFLGSLYVWLALNLPVHHRPDVLTHYLSAIGVGVLAGIFASVWQLTRSTIDQLEASSAKEDVQRSQLTSLVNSMADGVIAVDMSAKVVLYNAAALNVLDLNSSMQDKSLKKFMTLYDKEEHEVDIETLVLGTKLANVSRDYRIQYSDGSFANLYLSIAPVHLGYGKKGSQGYVLLLRDITREKSLEEERDEFISVVSHELRTPIAISEGNISNAQLIAERTGDMAMIKTALGEAHNQVLFLADMINDLATLSRAERGKLVLEVEPIDVTKLVQDVATNYKAEAEAKGLIIKTVIANDLAPLSSSKLYVREVLQNFVTNAIKYTEHGSVTVTVSQAANTTIFEVRDTGIGISKSDQERVFDKFFRSEDFRTRQSGGTGLGLYVTMKLTRLIHADIDVQSELNKGSTFRITIPSVNAEQAAKESVLTSK
ncbi:PAS domain-containing sensor histidine kinase [Aeromicrobium sp.]|nr:PAS domain-containing sensor histidine kinase [Candidatus Saccharibacteria bacterium]